MPTVTVSKSTAIWVVVGAVIVAIVAALLGGWIGGSIAARDEAAPAVSATPTPEVSESPEPDEPDEAEIDDELQDIIDDILPAGADVRAGRGAPSNDTGATGDIYINLTNSDVYVRRDSGWERVGNLRVDTAENLRGEQGAQGVPGAPGDAGAPGTPGQDGTQVVLGADAPDADATCEPDGSVYIDTSSSTYYSCVDAGWVQFGANADPEG